MIYLALIIGLDIFCITHCIRNKRNYSWFLLIIFAPLIGGTLYLFAEVFRVKTLHPTKTKPYEAHHRHENILRYRPSKEHQEAERQKVRKTHHIDSLKLESEHLMQNGQYQQAAEHYHSCLQGPLENDPELLYKTAEAQFAAQNHKQAIELLSKIRALSDYRPEAVRLFLARVYAASEQTEKSEKIFQQIMSKAPSLESSYYYAVFLETFGDLDLAHHEFRQLLAQGSISNTNSEQKKWLQHAKNMLGTTGSTEV